MVFPLGERQTSLEKHADKRGFAAESAFGGAWGTSIAGKREDASGVEMFDLGCGGFLLAAFKAIRMVVVLRDVGLREGMWIFDWRWIGGSVLSAMVFFVFETCRVFAGFLFLSGEVC